MEIGNIANGSSINIYIVNLMPGEEPWQKSCISNQLRADSVQESNFFLCLKKKKASSDL